MFAFVCRSATIAAMGCASTKLTPIIAFGTSVLVLTMVTKRCWDTFFAHDEGRE
jgi:hypothetical protein